MCPDRIRAPEPYLYSPPLLMLPTTSTVESTYRERYPPLRSMLPVIVSLPVSLALPR